MWQLYIPMTPCKLVPEVRIHHMMPGGRIQRMEQGSVGKKNNPSGTNG